MAAGRDLIASEPGHVNEARSHGRVNRWTTRANRHRCRHRVAICRAASDDPPGCGQPGRAALSKHAVIVATSRTTLSAAEICGPARRHWGFENPEHWARDTV